MKTEKINVIVKITAIEQTVQFLPKTVYRYTYNETSCPKSTLITNDNISVNIDSTPNAPFIT